MHHRKIPPNKFGIRRSPHVIRWSNREERHRNTLLFGETAEHGNLRSKAIMLATSARKHNHRQFVVNHSITNMVNESIQRLYWLEFRWLIQPKLLPPCTVKANRRKATVNAFLQCLTTLIIRRKEWLHMPTKTYENSWYRYTTHSITSQEKHLLLS